MGLRPQTGVSRNHLVVGRRCTRNEILVSLPVRDSRGAHDERDSATVASGGSRIGVLSHLVCLACHERNCRGQPNSSTSSGNPAPCPRWSRDACGPACWDALLSEVYDSGFLGMPVL